MATKSLISDVLEGRFGVGNWGAKLAEPFRPTGEGVPWAGIPGSVNSKNIMTLLPRKNVNNQKESFLSADHNKLRIKLFCTLKRWRKLHHRPYKAEK